MAVLKVFKRSELGSRKVRPLREKGEVPGVIYGHGEETLPVRLSRHDLDLAVHHGERMLKIDVEGKSENVLIKELQYDTYGQEILHVDLARVSLDERVEITVPIVLRGTPVGVEEGGVLTQVASDVVIECVVTAIPDEIRVQVTELKTDETMQMKDLPLPEGATLISDPERPVCTVNVLAEEEEVEEVPAEEAEAAEPEVIGEKEAEPTGEGE
ncbi:MAG: 50S ribosomal protein L25 [Phycisphaerae bacterium]|nr:50S ribosomal protein L25 [Phycisphaerae bacterium]